MKKLSDLPNIGEALEKKLIEAGIIIPFYSGHPTQSGVTTLITAKH